MSRQTALVKVSGDLYDCEDCLDWIAKLTKDYFVVICIGGGTQINEAFRQRGFPIRQHGPLGRETETFQERQLARDVLEENQLKMQDLLAERGIIATVIIPVLDIGSVLCHVNGDIFILAAYHGFDRIYVITTPERTTDKGKSLTKYPKIEVIAFSD